MFDRARDDVHRALAGRSVARTRQESLQQQPSADTVIDPSAPDDAIERA